MGRQVVDWRHALDQKWGGLYFGEVQIETNADHHVFEVKVFLNDLDPNAVRVELYADGIGAGDAIRKEMKCTRSQPDPSGPCAYHATVPSARPASDYTAAIDTSALRGGGSI